MKKRTGKRKAGGSMIGVLKAGLFILAVLLLTYILSEYVFERVSVHNHSMEHTLESGDSVMIDKISYRFRDPRRFEIIVFKQKGSEDLIKRVVGLPNETVQISDGKFLIDGEAIDDVKGLDLPEYAGIAGKPIQLLDDEYFVVGDNREESIDSRYEDVGLVTQSRIKGRMFMRVYPFKKIRFF